MSHDPEVHAQTLAEIRQSQGAVRDRVAKHSWRYDLAYAAIAAFMVGGQAAPMPLNVLVSGGSAMAFGLMWRRWSEKTGVSVTGLSPRRARWVALALGLVFIGLMLASLYAGRAGYGIWILPLAAVGFVMALVFSRLWMKVYLNETERRP